MAKRLFSGPFRTKGHTTFIVPGKHQCWGDELSNISWSAPTRRHPRRHRQGLERGAAFLSGNLPRLELPTHLPLF